MAILFLIYLIYIHRHYHHSHIYKNSWHALSNGLHDLSWQSVALDSREVVCSILTERLWSCIFRNWYQLTKNTLKISLSFIFTVYTIQLLKCIRDFVLHGGYIDFFLSSLCMLKFGILHGGNNIIYYFAHARRGKSLTVINGFI